MEHGLAEAVAKMSFGNGVGFLAEEPASAPLWYTPMPGGIVAEVAGEPDSAWCTKLGVTTGDGRVTLGPDSAPIDELLSLNESVLEDVYPSRTPADPAPVPVLEAPAFSRVAPKVGAAKPKVLIPVFPGTN